MRIATLQHSYTLTERKFMRHNHTYNIEEDQISQLYDSYNYSIYSRIWQATVPRRKMNKKDSQFSRKHDLNLAASRRLL